MTHVPISTLAFSICSITDFCLSFAVDPLDCGIADLEGLAVEGAGLQPLD
jgi:hypothetical protein